MPDAFDVFLCYCGADGRVKQMLDYVRSKVQDLPPPSGGASIRVFRDEDDLHHIGLLRDQIEAAVRKAPIGGH